MRNEKTDASMRSPVASPSPIPKDIPALTGLRGIAAFVVVLHHAWNSAYVHPGIRAQWAVDLFFVLSGFVMALTYLKIDTDVNWKRFYSSRIARIYPLYAFSSVIMAALFIYGPFHAPGSHNPGNYIDFIREATMTTAWPIIGGGLIWNYATWSISVETFAYAIFSLFAFMQKKIQPCITAGFCIFLAITLGIILTAVSDPNNNENVTRGWLALARALVGFSGGWAAFRLLNEDEIRVPAKLTDLICLCATIAIVISGLIWRTDVWIMIPVYPIIVMGLATADSISSRVLSNKYLLFLGQISFSVYLVHPIFLHACGHVLRKIHLETNPLANMLLLSVVTIPAAILSFEFVEKPSRLWIRSILDPRDRDEPKVARDTF